MAQIIPAASPKLEKLEAIRGAAAVYVVIHHLLGSTELKDVTPALLRAPFRFGQEAVIIFFLMSGFVIYLATYKRPDQNFRDYFIKRLFRIYPIFVSTLLLSLLISVCNADSLSRSDGLDLLGNLSMLQDTGNKPGTFVYPFLHNHALWSLSYEWWFYMLFLPLTSGLAHLRRYYTGPGIYPVCAISVVAYVAYLLLPNHLLLISSYLVLWWAGVACAELYCRGAELNFKALKPIYFSLLAMTLLTLIPLRELRPGGGATFNVNDYPFIDFRHYAFALLSIVAVQFRHLFRGLNLAAPVRWFSAMAGLSYALYCVHFPIFRLRLPFISNLVVEYVAKLVLILLVAYLLEIKIQPWWNRLAKKLLTTKTIVPAAQPVGVLS